MRPARLSDAAGPAALVVALAALALGGYAALRKPPPAVPPAACSCEDEALRRDLASLSRRVDGLTLRGAPAAPGPAAPAEVETSTPSAVPVAPRPLETSPDTVEIVDGHPVVKRRLPDGSVVITRTTPP